jgi:hypothetical protein
MPGVRVDIGLARSASYRGSRSDKGSLTAGSRRADDPQTGRRGTIGAVALGATVRPIDHRSVPTPVALQMMTIALKWRGIPVLRWHA